VPADSAYEDELGVHARPALASARLHRALRPGRLRRPTPVPC
jgi:hypothetical protein